MITHQLFGPGHAADFIATVANPSSPDFWAGFQSGTMDVPPWLHWYAHVANLIAPDYWADNAGIQWFGTIDRALPAVGSVGAGFIRPDGPPEGGPHQVVDAAAPVAFVLTASGIVGFAFFLMEMVWYRMLGPLLGGSVFTFGLILGIALAGIGIGGLIYSLFGVDRPATVRAFAVTCLLEAVSIAFAFALGDRIAMLATVLTEFRTIGFLAHLTGWTAVTSILVFPAALVAGYQFPLLVALLGRGRDGLGRQLGLTYATNTIGAIIGSLAGGFGILPG
jgi:hypothetical protein